MTLGSSVEVSGWDLIFFYFYTNIMEYAHIVSVKQTSSSEGLSVLIPLGLSAAFNTVDHKLHLEHTLKYYLSNGSC